MRSDRLNRCIEHRLGRTNGHGAMRFAVAITIALALIPAAATEVAGQTAPQINTTPPPPSPVGIWFDDTGQGAIEIGPCGEMLCGRIVWLKDPASKTGGPLTDALNPDPRQRQRPICGIQIIGGLEKQPNGAWDNGWIYDPKEGKSYDVEIRLNDPDRLQVKGYLGVKFLSETFIWQRAPAELQRCNL